MRKLTAEDSDQIQALKGDLIRADGRIERLCEHGVGHTVGFLPDTPAARWADNTVWVHGCDGCCSRWNTQVQL